MSDIIVVGSLNVDMVSRVEDFPVPGQTIKCKSMVTYHGGKGANQAVAANRAGASVTMIGAIGGDSFGSEVLQDLQQQGVNTQAIAVKPGPTGLAYIMVNDAGQNQIVLTEGANGLVKPEDMNAATFDSAKVILLQNEIPWETNLYVLQMAKERNIPVVLNPAPALQIPSEILPLIGALVLNESEAHDLLGKPVNSKADAILAASTLIEYGVREVIVTLGAHGSLYMGNDGSYLFMPAFSVEAVDTTSAGDTFIGYYAASICLGLPVHDALCYASGAAAISVTRQGAQVSIPSREEVEAFLNNTR